MSTRLLLEHESVCQTLMRTDHAWLIRTSLDLLRHDVVYSVRTVVRDSVGRIREEDLEVSAIFQLHPDHPRVAPLVICQRNDVYNTHIHDVARGDPPFAAVCMGTFFAEQRLGEWIAGLWDVLRWARIATDHPLNPDAAAWARRESATPGRFPVDPRRWSRRTPPAPGAPAEASAEPGALRIVSPWRSS